MSRTPKPRPDSFAKLATAGWFRAAAPKVLPPIHRGMRRLTRGKFVPGATLVLTSTGAKSGLARETPLEAIPDGDDFLIVGSNFAQDHHPAWTTNLIANPQATALVRGRSSEVTASLLTGDERADAWTKALAHFSGWDAYGDFTDREFRIFRLRPTT